MQKRRERIEKWRKEKNKGKSDNAMVSVYIGSSQMIERYNTVNVLQYDVLI